MSATNLLTDALFGIYSRAGAEVTYVTDRGERRPYWANRYLQALKRAVSEGDEVSFVERLVTQPEPSRGFFYLKEAGRLDLSVEALVVDTTRPFHHVFSDESIAAAEATLAEHGWARAFEAETEGREARNDQSGAPIGLTIGKRKLTLTATYWYLPAVSGLRGDQVQTLNAAIADAAKDQGSSTIGGDHILLGLLETDLYEREWPDLGDTIDRTVTPETSSTLFPDAYVQVRLPGNSQRRKYRVESVENGSVVLREMWTNSDTEHRPRVNGVSHAWMQGKPREVAIDQLEDLELIANEAPTPGTSSD